MLFINKWEVGEKGKLMLTEECQVIDVDRMIELENHQFATPITIIDSSKDH